ncbi:Unknown protein [Striga hermonthica]|uniref:hAT-like transposase RNase-H fold domain-containing protein n=1 Tax=Striga hermonthica TaxID=68872 RepID=A0A9N7RA74_STRHE|nr:Unknown protein [Striga hermonthica]
MHFVGTKRQKGSSGPSGCSRTSISSTLRRASSDDPQPEPGCENATFEEEPVETSNAYEDEEGESDEKDDGVPRKRTKRRAEAWKHFDLIRDKNGMQRAKCKHCEKSYAAHTKLNGGTYEKIGLPTKYDWTVVEKFVKVLRHFYDLTLRVSGSLFVTSNIFFDEIFEVHEHLMEWMCCDDIDLVAMARKMKEKFDKYWVDVEKFNMILYVGFMLDPRHKFGVLHYYLKSMYGSARGEEIANLAKSALYEIFDEYKKNSGLVSSTSTSPPSSNVENVSSSVMDKKMRIQELISGIGLEESELDTYLNERLEKASKEGLPHLSSIREAHWNTFLPLTRPPVTAPNTNNTEAESRPRCHKSQPHHVEESPTRCSPSVGDRSSAVLAPAAAQQRPHLDGEAERHLSDITPNRRPLSQRRPIPSSSIANSSQG